MAEPTTVKDAIEQSALGPAEAHSPEISYRQHTLADQIAADRYLAGRDALADNGTGVGMRLRKIRTGDAG